MADLDDLGAFVAVARARGFRDAARLTGQSASGLSDTIRRLETRLGVRLLNRTTRSVAPTEVGQQLFDRLAPALADVAAALEAAGDARDRPAGVLRLNVPGGAARLVLPAIIPGFLAAYPGIRLDVTVDESFVDVLAAGCDAGIRYDERLEADMIAVPIGPRRQRFATAGSPAYLARHGTPAHPHDLLAHACLRGRFASGSMPLWEFERSNETVRVDVTGPLVFQMGGAVDLALAAALAGTGLISIFEDWLRPHLDCGALVPVLEDWWPAFTGPFLYYPGRRLVPAPLRAFVDYIRATGPAGSSPSSPAKAHG